jgi:hypothetical protein
MPVVVESPDGPIPYVPSVDEVAAYIPARTKTAGGQELGTFQPEDASQGNRTRPTSEQVEALIPTGVRKVADKVGARICPSVDDETREWLEGSAKDLSALATALTIELRYFPEQVGSGQSPYKDLLAQWESGIVTLQEAISERCGGGGGESVGGSGPMPVSSFPCASGFAEEIT